MGVWGTGVFSNDDACDVRSEYTAIIGSGINDEMALEALKSYFKIQDLPCEEDADFWYAMAALQCKYGRLCGEVKENALECIRSGFTTSPELWFEPKDSIKRINVLEKLKNDILSNNSACNKQPKLKLQKALGKQGDVIAYHLINYSLESEIEFLEKVCEIHKCDISSFHLNKEPWFIGKYILLYISRIESEPISKAMPELPSNEYTYCMMYDWIGNELPDISVTKGLPLTEYSVIPQKKGGVNKHWEMTYEPHSKIRLRKGKYLFNIGQAIDTVPLPFDNSAQTVFDMESELDSLFKLNKDIELRYKKMVGNC